MTRKISPNRRRSFIDQIVDKFVVDEESISKNRWAKINDDTNSMYERGVKCARKGDLSQAESCFTRALNARTFMGGVTNMGVVLAHMKLAVVLERKGDVSCSKSITCSTVQ